MTRWRKEEDHERLATALRANLTRRKAQARQRQESEPRQRQESEPRQSEGGQRRPTEGVSEPNGPGAGDGSHDSAGFVGDKPG